MQTLHKVRLVAQVLHDRKFLAVADEEGYVTILDTTAPAPREIHEGWPPAQWLAHHNAIFDVAWCKVSISHSQGP